MMTKRILVTGGSGKAGRAVVRHLLERDYTVVNADIVPPQAAQAEWVLTDLTDYGQAVEVMAGCDAVVHLAAIPAPGRQPAATTFDNNTVSTYNVFRAAQLHGINRVVWASSETTLGLPFDREQPAYAPIDEAHPLYPESSYALSKVLGEAMARQFNRWTDGALTVVGLRISNIMELHDYTRFPGFWDDATIRRWNLWGYVDADDVAQACRLGVEADVNGADFHIIAAADTCMTRTSADLMAEVYPDVALTRPLDGHETLLSIDSARAALGYVPQTSWRDHISA